MENFLYFSIFPRLYELLLLSPLVVVAFRAGETQVEISDLTVKDYVLRFFFY